MGIKTNGFKFKGTTSDLPEFGRQFEVSGWFHIDWGRWGEETSGGFPSMHYSVTFKFCTGSAWSRVRRENKLSGIVVIPGALRYEQEWQSKFVHAVELCFLLAGYTCGDEWTPDQHFFDFAFAELLGVLLVGNETIERDRFLCNRFVSSSARLPSDPTWLKDQGGEEEIKRVQRKCIGYSGPFWCDIVRGLHGAKESKVETV